jgi:CBS domain-containing membrane protein
LRLFHPILSGARGAERLVACLGAALGIALAVLIAARVPMPVEDLPLLFAPIGASAVLVFAMPASPLAQPWPVIGGNTVSAAVGVAAYHLIPEVWLATGLAVGAAILVMSLLRCLHPPGGAAALTAVIGSPAVHAAGLGYAAYPVALNSVSLVLVGLLFHRLAGRSYPHRAAPVPDAGLHLADIDAALEEMHESFDISREDLDALLSRAEHHAMKRKAR